MTTVEVLNGDGTPVLSGRPRRRRSVWARRRASVALGLVATATVVFGIGLVFRGWVETSDALPTVAEPPRVETIGAPAGRATRIVFPYLIVPGGVHSADDARKAAAIDPVVAEHYRDVEIDALRLEHVTRPRAVYVSYRRGNVVFWTKHRLILQPGETLLSDGKNELRGRCGNRVSEWAQSPVADSDPVAEAFDQPMPIVVPEPPLLAADPAWDDPALPSPLEALVEPLVARQLVPGLPVLLPGLVPLVSGGSVEGGGNSFLDPADPAAVPEPGTLLLLGVGLAGAILRLRKTGWHRAS